MAMGRQVGEGGVEAATTTLLHTLLHYIFTKYPCLEQGVGRSRWGGEVRVGGQQSEADACPPNSLDQLPHLSLHSHPQVSDLEIIRRRGRNIIVGRKLNLAN